jgi:hypothetical protein
MYDLYFQGSYVKVSTLKNDAVSPNETPLSINETERRHITNTSIIRAAVVANSDTAWQPKLTAG